MKQLSFLVIFLFIVGLTSFGQSGSQSKKAIKLSKAEIAEQQKILQIEEDLRKAKVESNVKLIEEILADNYKGINQYGVETGKARGVSTWAVNRNVSLSLDSVSVTLVDDKSAIAKGLQTENGIQMSFERQYAKQDGNWRVIFNRQKMIEFKGTKGIGKYRIVGHVTGADNMALSLMTTNAANGKITNLNAAIVKDGTFSMEGEPLEYPQLVFLTTPGKNERASFFLENTEITIRGNLDSLTKIKVTGSKTQDEYMIARSAEDAFKDDYLSFIKQMQEARQSKDTAKINQVRKGIDAMMAKIFATQIEFVKNHPKSYASPAILQNLFNYLKLPEFESLVNSLDPDVARTTAIIFLKTRIKEQKVTEIGQKAPDFTLTDQNGVPVSLYSKLGSKLLLVDFWAAWCAPCRAENPSVVKVYNEFKSKGFDIFGVSLDRTKEDWIQAIAKDNLTWTHVSDLLYWNSAAAKLYAVKSIPANFLLDQNGIILAKNIRGEDLYNKVKELLGGK
jgi:peroxiredoxin